MKSIAFVLALAPVVAAAIDWRSSSPAYDVKSAEAEMQAICETISPDLRCAVDAASFRRHAELTRAEISKPLAARARKIAPSEADADAYCVENSTSQLQQALEDCGDLNGKFRARVNQVRCVYSGAAHPGASLARGSKRLSIVVNEKSLQDRAWFAAALSGALKASCAVGDGAGAESIDR